MAHDGRSPVKRHERFVASRGTHSSGGFDPTVPTDPMYGSQIYGEQIGAWQVPPGSINDGTIDTGGLDGEASLTPGSLELTPFADGVRPVAVVAGGVDPDGLILLEDGFFLLQETGDELFTEAGTLGDPGDLLPVLPNASYPAGAVIYNITDGKLYRNVADVWVRAVDGLDLIADSVIAGAIAAGVIETTHFAATATIALVTNTGATVVIDPSGIAVINGAISVANGADVVIIDGTSDIFKIAAEGTQTVTAGAGATATTGVLLNALAPLSVCPVAVQVHSEGNIATAHQSLGFAYDGGNVPIAKWAGNASGGVTDYAALVFSAAGSAMAGWILLGGGGSDTPYVRFGVAGASGGGTTGYQKYFVLIEAAF